MAKWYYYDKNGTKVGPVESEGLKRLAENGVIDPATEIETEGGKKSLAGKIRGLAFEAPPAAIDAEPLAPVELEPGLSAESLPTTPPSETRAEDKKKGKFAWVRNWFARNSSVATKPTVPPSRCPAQVAVPLARPANEPHTDSQRQQEVTRASTVADGLTALGMIMVVIACATLFHPHEIVKFQAIPILLSSLLFFFSSRICSLLLLIEENTWRSAKQVADIRADKIRLAAIEQTVRAIHQMQVAESLSRQEPVSGDLPDIDPSNTKNIPEW